MAPPSSSSTSIKAGDPPPPVEHVEKGSESPELNSGRRRLFRNTVHEILFIIVVTSAQLFTQANLGNTITPIRYIAQGLNDLNPAHHTWYVASYSCTVGAFVLVTGRLGDLFGLKTLFIIGWAWLALFSLASGFCKDHIAFDIVRALAGIGPGILMPIAAALLAVGFEDQPRKKVWAFCVFGAIAPGGYVVGGAWAAALVERAPYDWRWIFWSHAIVCVALAILCIFLIPSAGPMNLRAPSPYERLDILGCVTGVLGLVAIFVAVNGGPTFGWRGPTSPVLLIVGVLLIVLFVYIENRTQHPILPLRIFRSPTFVSVALSLGLGWSSFGMFCFFNPQFLQGFRGISGLEVSLQMVPCALIGVVAAASAVYLLVHVKTFWIFLTSMLCFFIGELLLALTPVQQTYWAMTFPTCLIICFGPDLSFACASLIASGKLRREDQGVAGSFVNTVVNFCVAMGLAVAGNVEHKVGGGTLEGMRAAYWVGVGAAGIAVLATIASWKGMWSVHGEGTQEQEQK